MTNTPLSPRRKPAIGTPEAARILFMTIVLVCILVVTGQLPVAAATAASWSPAASERLIKLPGKHLEKAVESDFRKSDLAAALQQAKSKTQLKQATLGDLQRAIERTDGETRYDLQHQFLVEKKNYVEILKENQDLRQKRATTKVRLYERLLGKLNRQNKSSTPGQKHLASLQANARKRFQSSLSKVDMKLMQSVAMGTSRYTQEYARNMTAIESLTNAVNAHPSNQVPLVNGLVLSQADYLRQLISQNEAEIALVNQERVILGHMAKLVSLDALALSEETQLASEDLGQTAETEKQPYSIDYFITQ